MKSLLIRIFVSFWLIIGITVGSAALAGYWYSERLRNAYDNFDMGDSLLEASAALASAGREGLIVWLRNYTETASLRVLVLDRNGRDLLDRPIPRPLRRMLDRQRRLSPPRDIERRDPDNFRRARPLSQLIGPDGARYTFVLVPKRNSLFFEHGLPARSILLLLALIVSAAVSLILARAISRPVRLLRDATTSLAAGDFASRVAPSVGRRRDELGLLARDFDTMAGNLQTATAQQVELSRNVSHELRSPLARLRVALELARHKLGDVPEFDRIDAEAERLDGLIAQILRFTRLDSIGDIDKQQINLNELITDVVADVNFECESAGLHNVSVNYESVVDGNMRLHEESMRSAIENVLRNAVRHSKPGSQISVNLSQESSDHLVIDVDDAGPGVSSDVVEKLFEPFFRTRQSIENGAGTGLGLAIAKRAVLLHGGSISAENRPAGGLRVRIRLPIHREKGSDTISI